MNLAFLFEFTFIFSHLANAFIQSDLQMRTTEAINCSIKNELRLKDPLWIEEFLWAYSSL